MAKPSPSRLLPNTPRSSPTAAVRLINVANNHSHDYGDQGFADTKENLKNAGLITFGYNETALVDVKGVKVGLVGIYELHDHLEREYQLRVNIQKVQAEGADLVFVIFHWGNEKDTVPDENQVTLAKLAIDNGADLVVGHHCPCAPGRHPPTREKPSPTASEISASAETPPPVIWTP